MNFNKNLNLAGKHAFLSPSNYHWLDYDEDKLRRVYFEKQQAALGDKKHAFAQQAIELKVKQAENGTTLSRYINDVIGFRMFPEVPLYYTDDCFGTADALGIRDNILRIFDLKTGVTPASMKQLLIYAALFFLQYSRLFDPREVRVILRIYQSDDFVELEPDVAELLMVIEQVKNQARIIGILREED